MTNADRRIAEAQKYYQIARRLDHAMVGLAISGLGVAVAGTRVILTGVAQHSVDRELAGRIATATGLELTNDIVVRARAA